MSVARLHTVLKARKDQGKCGKCGTPLPAGSAYRHFSVGFRSSYVQKRCMKVECTPRPSERESSKLSAVYSAMEGAEDELAALRSQDPGTQDDVTSIITTVAESIREVADEYREADEMIGGGGSGATISGERADELEEAASSLEYFSPTADPEEADVCGEHAGEDHELEPGETIEEIREACDNCRELRAAVWDELITEAETELSNVAVG